MRCGHAIEMLEYRRVETYSVLGHWLKCWRCLACGRLDAEGGFGNTSEGDPPTVGNYDDLVWRMVDIALEADGQPKASMIKATTQ